MLENMIALVLNNLIEKNYRHIFLPSCMYAEISFVSEDGCYYLKILGKNGEVNDDYPEIVDVRSEQILKLKDKVVITLPYGELSKAFIVGKVE